MLYLIGEQLPEGSKTRPTTLPIREIQFQYPSQFACISPHIHCGESPPMDHAPICGSVRSKVKCSNDLLINYQLPCITISTDLGISTVGIGTDKFQVRYFQGWNAFAKMSANEGDRDRHWLMVSSVWLCIELPRAAIVILPDGGIFC
jgi:hypothetical protein